MWTLQILNEDVVKKTCEDSQLCVIAVLPHILDTGETGHTSDTPHTSKLKERHVKCRAVLANKCWLIIVHWRIYFLFLEARSVGTFINLLP